MKKLILNLCVLGVLCGQIQAATVEAEGRAPGDMIAPQLPNEPNLPTPSKPQTQFLR